MKKESNKISNLWLIPGYLFGLPIAAILLFFATNEYLLPAEVGRLLLVFLVVGCLLYRLFAKRPAHTLFFASVFLACYNFIMVAGGFLFLGTWAIVIIAGIFLAAFFLLRGVPRWKRPGIALVLIALIGIFLLRQREFSPEKCNAIRPEVDPVFHLLDDKMHAYDFAATSDPPQLVATFGIGDEAGKIATYDLATLERRSTQKLPWRGVQRLTPHPDGRHLFVAAWGHWETDQVMAVVNPNTGRIPRRFSTAGCRNAFEVVYNDKNDQFYLLCEASHNILQYNFSSDKPADVVSLPGWDSYDIQISRNGNLLYVSDWFSQNLLVLHANALVLLKKIPIGWTAFGIAESPDGRQLYVARPLTSEVVVVDLKAGQPIYRIPTDFGPRDLEVDIERKILFVGNYFDGTLQLFDLESFQLLGSFYAGKLLRGLYYDPGTDRLFLATGCSLLYVDVKDLI